MISLANVHTPCFSSQNVLVFLIVEPNFEWTGLKQATNNCSFNGCTQALGLEKHITINKFYVAEKQN